MTADERQAALTLLEAAQRQIDAARTLLGGRPVAGASSQAPSGRNVQTGDGKCPECKEKAGKVKSSIGKDAKDLCGACGYEYP
ncbi:MAG: hypothetical protein Q8T13_04915 [Acidobacteriota bacterium]|nr:hypothetical protein [Acidobacteriota bacterium]